MVFLLIVATILAVIAALQFMTKGESLKKYDTPDWPTTHLREKPSKGYNAVADILERDFTQPAMQSAPDSLKAKRKRLDSFGETRDFETEFNIGFISDTVTFEGHDISGEWTVSNGGNSHKRILYIHGGAFAVGSAKSHRPFTSQLASRTGCAVFAPNYRLIPEHTRLDGITDCRATYDWILANGPDGPSKARCLAVGGDSAGGNLTLMLAAWARDTGRSPADALFAFSPTLDTTMSSPSVKDNFDTDVMLKPLFAPLRKLPNLVLRLAMWKQSAINPKNPIVSPMFGDLSRLPSTLIQASEAEMLYGDSVRYVRKAQAAGNDATLQTWQHMPHIWPIFDRQLEEADEALGEVSVFLTSKM